MCKTLSSDLHEYKIARVSAILSSKSIIHSADVIMNVGNSIVITTNKMKNKVEELNKTLEAMIISNNKMYKATIVFSIVMAFLTCAIAFSALVQARIIQL